MDVLQQTLESKFNFSSFRPGQKDIIQSIIEGKDTIALMPTGGGKSLCYQLPAIVSQNITLVISPLIALIKDQVDSLTAHGISSTFINSSLDNIQMDQRLNALQSKQYKLVYIAPERFESPQFKQLIPNLPVDIVAIDEAHCISQWGHDFRPEYARLKEYIDLFPTRPTITAFTATATPEVKQDIITQLHLQNPNVFVRGFDRPNLHFFARHGLTQQSRLHETLRLIKSIEGAGIVYTLTIKEAEKVTTFLKKSNVAATIYHSKIDDIQKNNIQEEFMDNKHKVIVATIAFGMGIDKADIRFVIHHGMPPNMERYYQEAGRAGRDGEKSYCVLLHSGVDNSIHYFFINNSRQNMQKQSNSWSEVQALINHRYERLEQMQKYVQSKACRRKRILQYFDDPAVTDLQKNCHGCDICLNYTWESSPKKLNKATKKQKKKDGELSNTVMETVSLYQQNKSPEQIAKIRHLAVNTILGHLIDWYISGGEFPIDQYVTKNEEEKISAAISKARNPERLSSIKKLLPTTISYAQIKMVLAKKERENHNKYLFKLEHFSELV